MAIKQGLGLIKQSVLDFSDDDCPTMAAALSYYTIFSLPPLLVLILLLLGAVLDQRDIQNALEGQIGNLMGPAGREQVATILQQAHLPGSKGILATALGIGALLLGATGAFGQLQAALNRAWEVKPDPAQGGLRSFLFKRVFSFGMVLGVAFLLLVSLVVSAALSALGNALGGVLPGGLDEWVAQLLNLAVSFAVITLLFATIFKVVPDATAPWRHILPGAAVTALLFTVGKFLIGFYLGRTNPGEAFGAAGSLAVMLVWIYYSSMIVLFGAEFTQVWAERKGGGIQPEQGAIRVVAEETPAMRPRAS
jgi:membrane protein